MTKTKEGDVVAIEMQDHRYAFGRVLKNPLMAFYDFASDEIIEMSKVILHPVAFKIWVMNSALTSKRWKVIGNILLDDSLRAPAVFFKQDAINKSLYIYSEGSKRPASLEECKMLEAAAIWSAEHVEDRLFDHFHGQPNRWVNSLKIK